MSERALDIAGEWGNRAKQRPSFGDINQRISHKEEENSTSHTTLWQLVDTPERYSFSFCMSMLVFAKYVVCNRGFQPTEGGEVIPLKMKLLGKSPPG
jgi:hypothetical protein